MIYVGQSKIHISLDTKTDLTSMASAIIRFRRPDRTEGFYDAARFGVTSKITHDFTLLDAPDMPGYWTFWAVVTFDDGREGIGDPFETLIETPGGTVR